MFSSYTQSASITVFWARAEAGRLGAASIQPEHLLLGILAEDQGELRRRGMRDPDPDTPPALLKPFFSKELASALQKSILDSLVPGPPLPPSGDMLVSHELSSALQEAQTYAGNTKVGIPHLIWGLLSVGDSFVSHLLTHNGINKDGVDQFLRSQQKGSL